jgi:hypothetical protein
MPLRISGIFGNGHQIYPWIHINDVALMFLFALTQESLTGVYNAVAPAHNTYNDIIYTIENVTRRKTLHLPAPRFLMRLLLGEFADTLYASQRVSAEKILSAGFEFKYPSLEQAINQLFTD